MKRTFKIITIALTLLAVLSVCALAGDFEHYADSLNELGLFKGTDKGYELEREPTRVEAGVMLVRLLGAEEEALSLSYSAPFNDVYDWAKPYVQYLYDKGLTKGMSETKFGYSEKCTAQQYATFLLRALGYSDGEGGDFTYADAIAFAREKGVADAVNCNENKIFLRDNVVAMSWTALGVSPKSGEASLLAKLNSIGAIKDMKGYDKKFTELSDFLTSLETLDENKISGDLNLSVEVFNDGAPIGVTTQKVKTTSEVNTESVDKSKLSYVGEIEVKVNDEYAETMGIPENQRYTKQAVEYYYVDGVYYFNIDGLKVKTALSFEEAVSSVSSVQLRPGTIPASGIEALTATKKSDGSITYNVKLAAAAMSNILDVTTNVKYDAIAYAFTVKDGKAVDYKVDVTISQINEGVVQTVVTKGTLTNIKSGDGVRVKLPSDVDKYVETDVK